MNIEKICYEETLIKPSEIKEICDSLENLGFYRTQGNSFIKWYLPTTDEHLEVMGMKIYNNGIIYSYCNNISYSISKIFIVNDYGKDIGTIKDFKKNATNLMKQYHDFLIKEKVNKINKLKKNLEKDFE